MNLEELETLARHMRTCHHIKHEEPRLWIPWDKLPEWRKQKWLDKAAIEYFESKGDPNAD